MFLNVPLAPKYAKVFFWGGGGVARAEKTRLVKLLKKKFLACFFKNLVAAQKILSNWGLYSI